ncbi:MAG: MFS transporter [Microthrixaceae bacterium]|nr:MFS transporter [Microthrixaceae bacterium]
MFAGSAASNVGTWMQNVILIALAYDLTGSSTFLGVILFAQLGPMLVLSPVGGAMADRVNRRVMMITIAATQGLLSAVLAVVATQDDPNKVVLVVVVAGIGIGAALNAPVANAILPELAGRRDLQGAVALNSAAMNASRVVGPVVGGVAAALGGAPFVFAVNAATYGFVILAVATAKADFSAKGSRHESPLRQLLGGIRAARQDAMVGRLLLSVAVYSLFCLVFIYQMPRIAQEQFGLQGWRYTLLFSTFGLGSFVGAVSMGSWLAPYKRATMVKVGFFVFAVALGVFATTSSIWGGFASAFAAGAGYFVIVTALVTILQLRVADEVRGRVMGLWMMAWAGLVPVGGLLGGVVIDAVGMTPVLLMGAGVALILGATIDLAENPRRTEGCEPPYGWLTPFSSLEVPTGGPPPGGPPPGVVAMGPGAPSL